MALCGVATAVLSLLLIHSVVTRPTKWERPQRERPESLQPDARAVGASGAIFGLFGAALVMARNRNISLMQTGLLPVLGLNLIITFLPGSHIAYGAHLGGLIGGIVAAFAVGGFLYFRRMETTFADRV